MLSDYNGLYILNAVNNIMSKLLQIALIINVIITN